jgi:hypothetical protein
MRWLSRFLADQSWCRLLVFVVFLASVSSTAEGQQCNVDVQLTPPDDERGHGIVITTSGGYRNVAVLTLCLFGDCRFAIPRKEGSGGAPAELFHSFECLRPGNYTWEAFGACHSAYDAPYYYDDDRVTGAFTIGDNFPRFDVQVSNAATANVRVDYEVSPTQRDAIIYIPGVAGAEQWVQGRGTVVFTVPPGKFGVRAAWCAGGPNEGLRIVPIEVKGNSPPDVIFNAVSTDRVLIHKYRDDDTYPSSLQTADGQVRVNAVVRTAAGTPVAGQVVQFRLIDPPDTAPYVVGAGDDRVNDNYDGPGRLNGGPIASVVSNAAGAVSVTLGITGFAAGDNYQIEAIASPTFDCSLGRCSKSPVYTAWKRVYVEVNKMFRRGAYLAERAPAGSRAIPVVDTRPFPTPPFRVRLIHARAVGVDGGEDPFFFDEIAHVTAIGRDPIQPDGQQPGRLVLDPARPGLAHGYDPEEAIGPRGDRTRRRYLADAVGVITGARDADYFLPIGKFVKPTFAEAFVEHVWLTDAGAGDPDLDANQLRLFHDAAIPYEAQLDERNTKETSWLAMKWAQNAVVPSTPLGTADWPTTLPNHQILFAGSEKSGVLGESEVGDGFSTVWLYIATLGNATLRGEALTHELTHQWKVNQTIFASSTIDAGGHCDTAHGRELKMYHRRDLTCVMNASLYGNPNRRERADGILAFHYVQVQGGVDSEYLRIRRRLEPVPHNEEMRPLPR